MRTSPHTYTHNVKHYFHSSFIGGEIVSTFGSPDKVRLGSCKLIEEVMIGEDKVGVASIRHAEASI